MEYESLLVLLIPRWFVFALYYYPRVSTFNLPFFKATNMCSDFADLWWILLQEANQCRLINTPVIICSEKSLFWMHSIILYSLKPNLLSADV